MSAIFISKKRAFKKHNKCFIFLNGCYFVLGGPINMNVGMFWDNSEPFLKIYFHVFPQIQPILCQFKYKKYTKFQLPVKNKQNVLASFI